MTKWYRNIEGFPVTTLRDSLFPVIPFFQISPEIQHLFRVSQGGVSTFYNECKIYTSTGRLLPLVNNGFSNEIFESIKNKFTIIVKERQTGLTTTEAVIALYYTQFLNKNVTIVSRGNIIDKIKSIYVNLPDHLKYGIKRLNKKCIYFNNGTFIRFTKCSGSFAIRYNPGLMIFDEYDFLQPKKLKIFINQIVPCFSPTGSQIIIGSSLNPKSNNKEGSINDLLTNPNYSIYSFKSVNLTKMDLIAKTFERDKKINEVLG
jgi:hypothetical protein